MQVASLAGNRDLEVRGDIRIGYGIISLTAGVGTDPTGDSETVWNPPREVPRGGEGAGVDIPQPCLSLVEGCSWALSSPALSPACGLRVPLQPQ